MRAERSVVVVGGGPAGSFAALLLARAGIAVTLVERAAFPRRKVCGEYLNLGALALLDEQGLGTFVRTHGRALRGMTLASGTSRSVDLPFPGEARALARADFDAFLLDSAQRAGVAIVRAQATNIRTCGGRAIGVDIRDPTGEERTLFARFIIGADGCGSLTARKLGLAAPRRPAAAYAVGGHYRMTDLRDRVALYVGREGYAAVNPLDDARANVMLVVAREVAASFGRETDAAAATLMQRLSGGRLNLRTEDRIGPRVAVGPLSFRTKKTSVPGAVVVGDAAGFLNPFTGQGVFLALRCARSAAYAVSAALEHPEREAALWAAHARRQARDAAVRSLLTGMIDLLAHAPHLAPRAIERLARRGYVRETLTAAVSGTVSPLHAFSPWVLAGLLA